jgi:hypothetical protein
MSDAIHSQDAHALREDIAFMRTLAQQGASGPIFGGSILLATGLIYATASAAVWWVATRAAPEPGHWMAGIWGAAVTTQMTVTALIILALRGRGQGMAAANRSNRVFSMVWNAVGCAIMACILSFLLTAWVAHIPAVFAGAPAVVMALYGVAWAATAASTKERWTWAVAVLSFVFAVASGALAGSANLPLLFAAALLILLAAPGALLILRASVRS